MVISRNFFWPKTCYGRWMKEDFVKGLVSVIMPTYNREQWVTHALDSVVQQTYRPIELIIVDDGSTDNTQKVLADWQAKNSDAPEFTIRIISQQNTGAPGARNHGLIKSSGEFIQHFDDDDVLGPNKIGIQAEWLMAHSEYDMAYGSVYGLGDESKKPYQANVFLDQSTALLQSIRTHTFNTISPLYKRRAAFHIGPWHEQMTCGLDREYTARFLCTDLKYQFLPEAETFVRGYEEDYERASVVKTLNQKRGYYRSKLVSLDSLWLCLPDRYKKELSFRKAMAKEYLGISKELILIREVTLGRKGVRSALKISHGTTYLLLAVLMWSLLRILGSRNGTKTYAQLQSFLGSLYRNLRGLLIIGR